MRKLDGRQQKHIRAASAWCLNMCQRMRVRLHALTSLTLEFAQIDTAWEIEHEIQFDALRFYLKSDTNQLEKQRTVDDHHKVGKKNK